MVLGCVRRQACVALVRASLAKQVQQVPRMLCQSSLLDREARGSSQPNSGHGGLFGFRFSSSSQPDSSSASTSKSKQREEKATGDEAKNAEKKGAGTKDESFQWDSFVKESKEKGQEYFKQGAQFANDTKKKANANLGDKDPKQVFGLVGKLGAMMKEELMDMFDMKKSEVSTTRKRQEAATAEPGEAEEYTGSKELELGKEPERTGWSKKWDDVKGQAQTNAFFQKVLGLKEHKVVQKANEMAEDLRDRWETSDSRLVHTIQDNLQETEFASAMKEIRTRDPTFDMVQYLRDIKGDILPVMNAYLKGDMDVLKEHCSREVCERVEGQQRFLRQEGAVLDSRILDIKEVHLFDVKSFENSPLIIIRFALQQIKCVRDKYGNILEGGMDEIQAVDYLWALQQEVSGSYESGKFLPPRWVLRECQGIQEMKQIV